MMLVGWRFLTLSGVLFAAMIIDPPPINFGDSLAIRTMLRDFLRHRRGSSTPSHCNRDRDS
jgi:hypothetical protein